MRLDTNYKKEKKNCKKYKCMEIKKDVSKWPTCLLMKSKRKSNNFYNENTTENLWDAPKAFLRGKFIAIQSYLKKKKKKKKKQKTRKNIE